VSLTHEEIDRFTSVQLNRLPEIEAEIAELLISV